MLQIDPKTQHDIISLAASSGQTVDEFLEMLLEAYQDQQDMKDAEQALKEPGGISLPELRNKYGL
ncbi:MAG: hypothetical protein ACRERV_09640 [Methylococcales bacterium]